MGTLRFVHPAGSRGSENLRGTAETLKTPRWTLALPILLVSRRLRIVERESHQGTHAGDQGRLIGIEKRRVI